MRILPLALLLGLLAGCAHSAAKLPDYGGDDGNQIAKLVDQMNDDSNTIPKLKAVFATGTPVGKKDIKSFPQFRYEIKGNPNVNGDVATATVVVSRHTTSGSCDKVWNFVKEGTDWKIKSAPLP